MNPLEKLRARLGELVAANKSVIEAVDRDSREPTDDEVKQIDDNLAEIEGINADISRRERIQAAAGEAGQGQGRRTAASPGAQAAGQPGQGQRQTVPAAARQDDAKGGFRSFGEFAGAVRQAASGRVDNRLLAVATTYGNEGTGADGGFAVPPDFRQAIWEKVVGEDSLLSRTDMLTTSSNNVMLPKDETTPWQTSGGVQAYWESEGGQITASKPALDMMSLRLSKLTALVNVSDENLDDAPLLDGYLRRKAPEKMVSKINQAIIEGTGVGQPLGILRSGALVTVAKETSQPADTIVGMNVSKMWARMYAPSRRNAIWLINQDIEPQLDQLNIPIKNVAGTENVGGMPVYVPPGGFSATPYAMLKGRPVVPVQAAKTLGDLGDIMLVDLSQYLTLSKAGNVRTDTSIHLYFDQSLTSFRFVWRLAGQPWWTAPITPQNGTNTLSAFVALAERA